MKDIKIKFRDTQIPFVAAALEKFLKKCPMRFSSPEIAKGVLRIDPHDFLELINYIDVNFDNELESKRLKKTFIESLPKNIRLSDLNFNSL